MNLLVSLFFGETESSQLVRKYCRQVQTKTKDQLRNPVLEMKLEPEFSHHADSVGMYTSGISSRVFQCYIFN